MLQLSIHHGVRVPEHLANFVDPKRRLRRVIFSVLDVQHPHVLLKRLLLHRQVEEPLAVHAQRPRVKVVPKERKELG